MEKLNYSPKVPKIIVIENDGLFLEFMIDFLEESGFQVVGAHNGVLGLELAKSQMPDLMICDIRMPGLSGYDVLSKLRRDVDTENIPVVFLTAEQADSDRRRAIELGANDYLIKPFKINHLIEVINTQLNLHRLNTPVEEYN